MSQMPLNKKHYFEDLVDAAIENLRNAIQILKEHDQNTRALDLEEAITYIEEAQG